MKPVYQVVFDDVTGDCFQACAASIFELQLEDIPNFWDQTQDVSEFWRLNNDWFSREKGYRCISIQLGKKELHMVDGILCIALAKSPRGDIDHAVVWQDGIIHDPHPSNAGLAEEPDNFTLFIPLNPYETDYIKCRLCNWKTKRWTTNKKGKKVSGYHRLERHFMIEHKEEFIKMNNKLEET